MTQEHIKGNVSGSLEENDDLFHGIVRFARQHHCTRARITGRGTVRKATLSTYNQKSMKHTIVAIDEPMEILSMDGTVTEEDGALLPHVHLVLSNQDGNGNGGYMLPGSTLVVSCEIVLEPLFGDEPKRPVRRGSEH